MRRFYTTHGQSHFEVFNSYPQNPGSTCWEKFFNKKIHDKGCSIAHEKCCGLTYPYTFEMPGLYPDWDLVPLSFEVNNFTECSY